MDENKGRGRWGDVVTQKLASLHKRGGKITPMTDVQLTTDKKNLQRYCT